MPTLEKNLETIPANPPVQSSPTANPDATAAAHLAIQKTLQALAAVSPTIGVGAEVTKIASTPVEKTVESPEDQCRNTVAEALAKFWEKYAGKEISDPLLTQFLAKDFSNILKQFKAENTALASELLMLIKSETADRNQSIITVRNEQLTTARTAVETFISSKKNTYIDESNRNAFLKDTLLPILNSPQLTGSEAANIVQRAAESLLDKHNEQALINQIENTVTNYIRSKAGQRITDVERSNLLNQQIGPLTLQKPLAGSERAKALVIAIEKLVSKHNEKVASQTVDVSANSTQKIIEQLQNAQQEKDNKNFNEVVSVITPLIDSFFTANDQQIISEVSAENLITEQVKKRFLNRAIPRSMQAPFLSALENRIATHNDKLQQIAQNIVQRYEQGLDTYLASQGTKDIPNGYGPGLERALQTELSKHIKDTALVAELLKNFRKKLSAKIPATKVPPRLPTQPAMRTATPAPTVIDLSHLVEVEDTAVDHPVVTPTKVQTTPIARPQTQPGIRIEPTQPNLPIVNIPDEVTQVKKVPLARTSTQPSIRQQPTQVDLRAKAPADQTDHDTIPDLSSFARPLEEVVPAAMPAMTDNVIDSLLNQYPHISPEERIALRTTIANALHENTAISPSELAQKLEQALARRQALVSRLTQIATPTPAVEAQNKDATAKLAQATQTISPAEKARLDLARKVSEAETNTIIRFIQKARTPSEAVRSIIPMLRGSGKPADVATLDQLATSIENQQGLLDAQAIEAAITTSLEQFPEVAKAIQTKVQEYSTNHNAAVMAKAQAAVTALQLGLRTDMADWTKRNEHVDIHDIAVELEDLSQELAQIPGLNEDLQAKILKILQEELVTFYKNQEAKNKNQESENSEKNQILKTLANVPLEKTLKAIEAILTQEGHTSDANELAHFTFPLDQIFIAAEKNADAISSNSLAPMVKDIQKALENFPELAAIVSERIEARRKAHNEKILRLLETNEPELFIPKSNEVTPDEITELDPKYLQDDDTTVPTAVDSTPQSNTVSNPTAIPLPQVKLQPVDNISTPAEDTTNADQLADAEWDATRILLDKDKTGIKQLADIVSLYRARGHMDIANHLNQIFNVFNSLAIDEDVRLPVSLSDSGKIIDIIEDTPGLSKTLKRRLRTNVISYAENYNKSLESQAKSA